MKIYLLFLIFALIIPSSQAYASTSHIVTPSGSLAPGTPVIASIEIRMDISGKTTFPENNTLQLVTDLVNESWTYWVFLDNTGSPHPVERNRVLQITSWELTYRSDVLRKAYVRILLEGEAPGASQTKNITIFNLMELDPEFNIVKGSEVQRSAIVANPADIKNGIVVMTANLQPLQADINKKSALGVDISRGQLKYLGAQQQINLADNVSQSLYITGLEHLSRAENLTREGFKENDKAWAQKTLNDAEASLDKTDTIIEGFKQNYTDKEVPPTYFNATRYGEVINERAILAGYVVSAKTDIQNGNYERARMTSDKIIESGNQTFTDANDLKVLTDTNSLIRKVAIGIIIAAFIAGGIVIKYFILDKRKKEVVPK